MENIPWWAPLASAAGLIILALVIMVFAGDWGKNSRREGEVDAIRIRDGKSLDD